MRDGFKSVDVAEVDMVSGVEVEIVSGVEVEMVGSPASATGSCEARGLEVGICSLFVLSEKRIGGIFAIAKDEALKLSSALLN